MFLNMKNSFSLFELILTLAISTTIIIYSTLLVKDLIILNKTSLSKELARLELNSTKIFIEKNKNELNKFGLNNKILYFDNHILLKNVNEFNIYISNEVATINISLENSSKQVWKIAL
ncbi:hypothetical protein [Aliarcobacter cryaerophilus]|uniref:hypothetical protein n=1 Tax=Aliarcobacter cryaerophilus TaxID=28198 RepID=UPI000AC41E73|nr:hypothetical protein [Aliarcobacter cryaerophilus]